MRQGILCITSGPPLSGKSTFVGGFLKAMKSIVFISTDEIRFEMNHTYDFMPETESKVWATAYDRTQTALNRGEIVFFDATFSQIMFRGSLLQRFKKYPVIYFAFEKPPFELIAERNEKRYWKKIDGNVLKKLYDDYQFPTETEKKYYYRVYDVNLENFERIIGEGVEFLLSLYESKKYTST